MECIVRDVPVYYESYGSGLPIISIHGYTPDHRLMKGCMEPLFAQRPGWQRIYLDLPGMGQTPGHESLKSTDDMLDVVIDFIDAVIPGQPFLIAGVSYGGYLSRGVLKRKFDQVAGMALICPVILGDRGQRDLPPRTVIVENAQLLASLDPADAQEYGSMAVVQDENNWKRYREELLSGVRIANESFLQRLRQRYSYSFDVDVLPHPFSRPVAILVGRQDHVAGYRDAWRILKNYPRGTFAVLDRAGHNAHIEQSQLFHTLISEWLDRVLESISQKQDS
ncbi:MAG: alpha/beta hydrolase [Ktedonobacteraceae bacterium]|nr:alpha/beta hydrolase [Ktedonobacteraceae bacterium]